MKITKFGFYVTCSATLLLLAACETIPEQQDSRPVYRAPVRVNTTPLPPLETPEQIAEKNARAQAEDALKSAILLYDAGDYNGLIKQLSGSTAIRTEDIDLQVRAAKYMAFSYCVTNRQTLCRQQFDKILKMDPDFDLSAGEKGHPQWQRAFDTVKKRAQR